MNDWIGCLMHVQVLSVLPYCTRPTQPIIILTAKGRDIERKKGMSLGADDYMTKPFSTRDILNRVKELLAESENQ